MDKHTASYSSMTMLATSATNLDDDLYLVPLICLLRLHDAHMDDVSLHTYPHTYIHTQVLAEVTIRWGLPYYATGYKLLTFQHLVVTIGT